MPTTSQPLEPLEPIYHLRLEASIANELVLVILRPEITLYLKSDPEKTICYLRTECVFQCDGLKDYVEEGILKLPEGFWVTLINFAVGMARGILYAKNFGFSYSEIIMPPMNTAELIPKPMIIGNPADQQPSFVKASTL